MKKLIPIVLTLVLSGCDYCDLHYSRNLQRSNLRSVGDTTITIALDAVGDSTESLLIRDQIKAITEAVRRFLYSGDVDELTIPELTSKLYEIVPPEYSFIVDFLLAKVQGMTVDVGIIGADNIRRIDAACIGIIMACNEYRVEDRSYNRTYSRRYCVNGICYYEDAVKTTEDRKPNPIALRRFQNEVTKRLYMKRAYVGHSHREPRRRR